VGFSGGRLLEKLDIENWSGRFENGRTNYIVWLTSAIAAYTAQSFDTWS
jgi:hypothetical protein